MNNGLDDVLATETVLSDVDGAAGALIIRGRSLDELAGLARYEDVLALLLSGFFSDLPRPDRLGADLGSARQRVFSRLAAQDERLLRLPVTEAMRALLALIEDGDDLATALNLIAAPAVFTPALVRLKQGHAPIAPDPSAGHAKDVLRMLHGKESRDEEAAALDAYLVTVSDHGLNASTFAARVVASTQAGLTSAVIAGLCALKGPLHGGAPGPVLDMLDAIGHPEDAEAWLDGALDRGDRLMGFGHRIYKVRDPRADALMGAVRNLAAARRDNAGRFSLAESVEAAAIRILARRKPDRSLKTNVEFYTAVLLEALGFPRESFTSVFAMGRVGGWIGHAREQALYGRLIRPQSRYVGPRPDRAA
ncbi:citrate synthase/methylcitrate synthase [Methylocapsa sp. S129]|uniref:citrate synthase/methylcitrate synthase n=1 Tax=Methylocapsa sp. S129 TaxID=1641869 RepID=UPI00131C0CCD|nr:citrate synthase/methylcitrate synthase [Methylocapsa sp. S129]